MTDQSAIQDIWVSTTEGAEITGYNRDYVKKLMRKVWNQPENERDMRLRKRSFGYEVWLPDLVAYIQKTGRGPYNKSESE